MIRRLAKYARKSVELLWCFGHDALQYALHNTDSPLIDSFKRKDYQTIVEAHKIEKGLSLPRTRHNFGRSVITHLFSQMDTIAQLSTVSKNMTFGALHEYGKLHEVQTDDELLQALRQHDKLNSKDYKGGTEIVSPYKISSSRTQCLLSARRSCRDFSAEVVPSGPIYDVIEKASRAPSQCNRQSVRLKLVQEFSLVQEILSVQGCARGFAEDVSNLFIVCGDLAAWRGPQQRNQCFVDGGLLGSYLLLSLTDAGLESCALNWP